MDALVKILNQSQDIVIFKQAYNEMLRMLIGKGWKRGTYFKGEICDPENLNVKEVMASLRRQQSTPPAMRS